MRGHRLIPARAGKTGQARLHGVRVSAHPRAGGENWIRCAAIRATAGSSPRGRGKPYLPHRYNTCRRLIPARAGKTRFPQRRRGVPAAHPRAGGENAALTAGTGMKVGSSPRGRGKLESVGNERTPGGLIPARAGKTFRPRCRRWQAGAHPRAGGENTTVGTMPGSGPGSSPRGRGKPTSVEAGVTGVGLIPARAGKTSVRSSPRSATWAHPRAGGENLKMSHQVSMWTGSSPRGRGKPRSRSRRRCWSRLIPARAGKTAAWSTMPVTVPAHPRAGGENSCCHWSGSYLEGSSPRGRGKPIWL